ncbi:MAG: serine hydrolase domain-containing protein [Salibacteraceae bacterium]
MTKQVTLVFTLFLSSFVANAQIIEDSLIINYMNSNQIPGLVLGIQKGDSPISISAYGLADVQNSAPVENLTNFELASLSKQFTAAAILKLQEEGKLTVEDELVHHFPNAPNHWNGIKIKHLLWHTSGLPGMFPHDNFEQLSFTGYAQMEARLMDEMMQTNLVSKEISIKSILTDSLDFKPGTNYNYSDVGYLLLGIVIDNITGSYHNYMTNEIFVANGLNNTYLLNQEKVVANQARGYSLKNGELINIMRTWDFEIPSYFGVFSNAEDLLKWSRILDTNNFLNDQSKSFLFSKGQLTQGATIEYGAGWEINQVNGLKIISHNGVTGTRMIKIPTKNLTVVMLSNLGYNGNDMVDPWSLTNIVLPQLGVETTINKNHITSSHQKVAKFNKKAFHKIAGNYKTKEGIEARIFLKDSTPFFEGNQAINEIAFLENGTWLVLGLTYEYVLSYNSQKQELTSNYGRVFIKE